LSFGNYLSQATANLKKKKKRWRKVFDWLLALQFGLRTEIR